MRLKKEQDSNIFIPDIMVVCNPDILTEDVCDGAADWIVEVTSPVSSKNDYQRKAYHYRRGGVLEYWIIDAAKRIVTVFDYASELLECQEGITLYSFEECVPVKTYDGFELCMATLGF